MKALTIKQPWASLVALGEKRFETRSWQTHYRGPIAIHAGKTIDKEACNVTEIIGALLKHGIKCYNDLPTGSVIAIAELVDCHKIRHDYYPYNEEEMAVTENGLVIKDDEYWFGDYTPGRFAWELTNVRFLDKPIPAKGQLNLWNWTGGIIHESK